MVPGIGTHAISVPFAWVEFIFVHGAYTGKSDTPTVLLELNLRPCDRWSKPLYNRSATRFQYLIQFCVVQ